MQGFWKNLSKPIIALAPMDGVTDAAFRYVADKYGKPDILFTEFTNVEGISRGAAPMLRAFIHHKTTTPTVAQIFGTNPDAFYQVSIIVAEMGFDGIDINMGCPDKNVAKHGGGAGLILQPKLAQQIILACKRAMKDWADGKRLEDLGLTEDVVNFVKEFQQNYSFHPERSELPVSVKTRIGFEAIVTEDWIANLLETEPVNITVHGRTLRQLYSGEANWDEIAKAAVLAHKTKTTLLGNGDVKSLAEAHARIIKYGTDGALIGRAAFGNPWIFANHVPSTSERLELAVEQAKKFEELTPTLNFLSLRKHLAWYVKGFDYATDLRVELMQTKNASEVETMIKNSKFLPTD